MNLTIKQLQSSLVVFMPLTVAEAVLVKDNELVITLDTLLNKKIETLVTPAGSGLAAYNLGKNVIVTHSNSITATDKVSPVLVQYDNNGHIINSKPLGKITITVNNGTAYKIIDSSEDLTIQFGDDFNTDENNNIKLLWNNI